MSWARIHRWLAIVLAVPLVVWSVTGLLFHLKPGWGRAYDMLDAARPGTLDLGALARLDVHDATHLEAFDSALGPLYRVTTKDGEALYDAHTGARRSPLSLDDARALADDAVSRSPQRAGYGALAGADPADHLVHVRFAGGATVDVDRDTARISQRGADTDRIDWLYRIHYLQWTGNRTLDRVLAITGLALIWVVLIPGIVLFVRRVRA